MILSDRVKTICTAEGIRESEMQQICKSAAIASNGSFNRRFHGWLLDIRDGQCHNLAMASILTLGTARGLGWMDEEHEACVGKGCHACGWVGEVRRNL